jgi:lysozyme family protein
MDNNFDKCLAFVLKEEGGNDDDPNDHGGRTSRGIIQREWDVFIKTHPDRPSDVWKASDEDIKTIYHDEYWQPHCPSLPNGLDLVFFDFAVNAGVSRAIRTLQLVTGTTVDGVWGPNTEAAVKAVDPKDAINQYHTQRENFYKSLAQFSRYGKGWLNRNDACWKEAVLMEQPNTTFSSPKANPTDVKPAVPIHGPAASTVVVAAGTAASAHYHSPLLFLGVLLAAVAVGFGVHYLTNRKVS